MGSSMFVDVSVGDLLWGYEAMLPCYFFGLFRDTEIYLSQIHRVGTKIFAH
jgi:hypothetical protein